MVEANALTSLTNLAVFCLRRDNIPSPLSMLLIKKGTITLTGYGSAVDALCSPHWQFYAILKKCTVIPYPLSQWSGRPNRHLQERWRWKTYLMTNLYSSSLQHMEHSLPCPCRASVTCLSQSLAGFSDSKE